jgi:D-alanyl-D-alanine carboxypeptidase/D-alanyl-D-alanine-endopeptidase (penicillin-binding protein 4)
MIELIKPCSTSKSLFLFEIRHMQQYLLALKCDSIIFCMVVLFISCSPQKEIQRTTGKIFMADSTLQEAHAGVSIYDPEKKSWLYNYQADKYFIPASNIKIMSCYAGMKYLGNQLKGIEWIDLDSAILLYPTGDPTFLHPDYANQPVADFIRNATKPLYISDANWNTSALGHGWSWDDYSEYYMVERSAFPIYGNVTRWYKSTSRKENPQFEGDTLDVFISSEPEVNWPITFAPPDPKGLFEISRTRDANRLTISEGKEVMAQKEVPFVTMGITTALELLKDTVHKDLVRMEAGSPVLKVAGQKGTKVYSQYTDSMLKPMMHRSDNFFAEQTLLMVGREITGKFNEDEAINRLLDSDLKDLPQRPRWVDGSGLSRYNLFSPKDFIWVLDKMKEEFGMDRIKAIFPSPGSGTLRSFKKEDASRIYAKTGTLTGVIALSGFVYTKKNHWLIFSILINNHRQAPALLRKKMEVLLQGIIDKY